MKKALFFCFVLLFFAISGKSQIYADSVIYSSGVTAPKQAVTDNDSDYATMSTVIGVQNQSKLDLGFHPEGMGGMTCFVRVQPVNGIISVNLLQSLNISLYSRNGKKIASHSGFTIADAELLTGTGNIYLLAVTTDDEVNSIASVEIILSGSASISYKLRIYSARLSFACAGNKADSVINYNRVNNAENAVSQNKNDFASMTPPLVGSSYLLLHLKETNTNRIKYLLGKEGIIDVQLLSNIQLLVYDKHNKIIASQNGFTVAEADILANNKFFLSLKLPKGADNVTKAKIIFNGYGNQLSNLLVYRVVANNTSVQVKPHITPDKNITFCVRDSARLIAHPSYKEDDVTWQWYRNNVAIDSATDNVYYAKQRGDYFITVTSKDNCTNISNEVKVVKIDCLASATTINNSLQVYPNPFNGSTRLQLSNLQSGVVSVSDKSGRVIETFKVNTNQSAILLKSANSGIYFVKLVAADGKIYTAKAIKE